LSRKEDFRRVYGRYPTDEELRVFEEYINLIKSERSRCKVRL